jgi:hypothetical protein
MPRGADLTLDRLSGSFAVARLPAHAAVPDWARGDFVSVTRSADELSVVCAESLLPAAVRAERGFDLIRVRGTLDFSLVGVIAGIAATLAAAQVSVFVVSTHDTDYLLLPRDRREEARNALVRAGYGWVEPAC